MAATRAGAVVSELLVNRPHALYRFISHDGVLLYVGISACLSSRLAKHSGGKPWWYDVATIELEFFPNRQVALDAERRAIIAEKPAHNVTHNRPNAQAVLKAPEAPEAWWWPDSNLRTKDLPPKRTYPWPAEKPEKERKKRKKRKKRDEGCANEPEIQCLSCWHAKRAYGPDAQCKPCRRLDAGVSA